MASYTYSVEEVIDGAVERNQMNDRTKLAGNAELILLTSRKQQKIFLDVAKVAPLYFGASATLTLDGSYQADLTGLTGPARIVEVEIGAETGSTWTTGDNVHVVAYDDIDAEVNPKMYYKKDYLVGDAQFSTVTNINVTYAIMPAVLDSTQDPGDVSLTLPDEHIGYLIAEMAYYLALKDNRSEGEIALLKAEIEEEHALVLATAALMAPTGRRFA